MPPGLDAENLNYDIYGDKDADTILVTYGRLFNEAVKARGIIHKNGKKLCILKLCRIKPIDPEAVRFAGSFKEIHFFEEGMRSGSVADAMKSMLDELGYDGAYHVSAVENQYVQHAPVQSSLKTLGLDADAMAQTIL